MGNQPAQSQKLDVSLYISHFIATEDTRRDRNFCKCSHQFKYLKLKTAKK